MKKLLVICGPTAAGKTSLALYLAKVFKGEIVSADSRQVYRGMDIGTGKDLPMSSNLQFPISKLKKYGIGCYEIDGVSLWGYDLAEPKENFSVALYINAAEKIISEIYGRGKLPILVGGTGFYIKGIVDGIETSSVKVDLKLRRLLGEKSADELYNLLFKINKKRALEMNDSDRKNPRRLIRAIEIGSQQFKKISDNKKNYDTLFIGLTTKKQNLKERIKKRVEERLEAGIEKEIACLLENGIGWECQSMQSLGYRQWREYFEKYYVSKSEMKNFEEKKVERQKAIDDWTRAEIQYAKRQMTWFKKDKRIKWFDISSSNWRKDVEMEVEKWYIYK